MNITDCIEFACLTHQSPSKRSMMSQRFDQLGIRPIFYENPSNAYIVPDQELINRAPNKFDRHAWSVMHGHMGIISAFAKYSVKDKLIVFEDDVHIKKDFVHELPVVCAQFDKLNLDILMLGYLLPKAALDHQAHFELATPVYSYHRYENNIYGTQCYMVSKVYAQLLNRNYGWDTGWATKAMLEGNTYNADWIITKQGNRALIYPPMAIEQSGGGISYNDPEQDYFHQLCHTFNYDPQTYV